MSLRTLRRGLHPPCILCGRGTRFKGGRYRCSNPRCRGQLKAVKHRELLQAAKASTAPEIHEDETPKIVSRLRLAACIVLIIILTAWARMDAQAAACSNPYQSITMTDEERELLKWVLALEDQQDGIEGEMRCCEVIFNRVLAGGYGDGVGGVLQKKGQFATLKAVGKSYAWAAPGELEDQAIDAVIEAGPSLLPSTRYVYFDTSGRNGRDHVRYGGHLYGME